MRSSVFRQASRAALMGSSALWLPLAAGGAAHAQAGTCVPLPAGKIGLQTYSVFEAMTGPLTRVPGGPFPVPTANAEQLKGFLGQLKAMGWTRFENFANTFGEPTFNPATDWEGRHTAGYVVYKDKMWIVGGDVNQKHYQFDVWNSSDGKSWTHVNRDKPVPWGPRALHYTTVFLDKIFVIGGQTMPAFAPSEEIIYRDVWTTTDGVEWKKITPKEPCWSPRGMIGGGVVLKDRLWVLGGGTYDTPQNRSRNYYNDVWSTADGETWTKHIDAAPRMARQYHDVGVFDGRMWVMEGYNEYGGNRNDVWYSQDGVNWYEVPKTPWKARHAAGIYTYDNGIWMVGGNNMEPDAWKLMRK